VATFDDLKQTIKEIEFLADPTAGEVRIGCPESVAAILTPVIQRLMQRYPGLVVHVSDVVAPTLELPLLRDRSIDLALVRVARTPAPHHFGVDDLNAEVLFNDKIVVVAGLQSKWARRRKLDLAELVGEPWVLPPPHTLNSTIVMDAFRLLGPTAPKVRLVTYSVQLRIDLLANGSFISALPLSMMNVCADRFALKVLPVKLPVREWPVVMVMLKNRMLNPVVQVFIASLRDAFRSLAAETTK
jgi:DNA-binding transcriptional LysR family regulator